MQFRKFQSFKFKFIILLVVGDSHSSSSTEQKPNIKYYFLNSSQLCSPQTELVMKLLVRLSAIRNTLKNLKALFANTTLWGDVDIGVAQHFMIYQRQEMKEISIFDGWMFVLVTNLDWCKQTLLKAMRWKQKGNHLVFYLMWV